ncbi:MAG: hypothetical protein ACRDT8_24145 [Micromonosporaceae bacterium]
MTVVDGGEFLLDGGMFWCRVCRRDRRPALGKGERRYSCAPGCTQTDTPAVSIEQAAVLGALIRGYAVLHGVGRGAVVFRPPHPVAIDHMDSLPASPVEVRRWETCDVTNRRAVLRAAYTRIEIDAGGVIHRNWRHRAKTDS